MTSRPSPTIEVRGAEENNLKSVDVAFERGQVTVITGVSGSGKSSLAFDTVLAEAQRRFFHTLSHYSRQFLDLQSRPAVQSMSGLSPAIALAQNETAPSRRATVGTQTDLSELVGVLLARFGDQYCPEHDQPTAAQSPAEIAARLMRDFKGEQLAVVWPLAEAKKGTFKAQLTAAAQKGFLRAFVDGRIEALSPPPALNKDEKHTIKVVVDYVRLKEGAEKRLLRAIEQALAEGGGFGAAHPADAAGALDLERGGTFSAKGGCPICGFAWPRLDSRHFSANSLGRCEECNGLGLDPKVIAGEETEDGAPQAETLYLAERTGRAGFCAACNGTGLDAKLAAIKLRGVGTLALHALPLAELSPFLGTLVERADNPALRRVADEALATARRVDGIGLGYLTLSRRVRSLSGGEAQRLRLAGILSESLRGVLYVLDEPSQGLHPTEIDKLWSALARLRDAGNTILVVDHDEQLMRLADWIVDLGPGGGARGGKLLAKFKPQDAAAFARQSATAAHLAGLAKAAPPVASRDVAALPKYTLKGVKYRNLDIPEVSFPVGALTVVAGVSGAGKTSLTLGTLLPCIEAALDGDGTFKPIHCKAFTGHEHAQTVELIDRRPLAKSSVSMPATYLDVFGVLRDLYAALPDAQVMGLTARTFSLNADDGRCPECKGKGQLNLSMRFLADARVRCPTCKGARYRPSVLAVRYLGLNMCEVLDLTLDEAVETFKNHKKIVSRLQPAVDLGLGYLKLGQPSSSLSGGEAQRLKLVPYLARPRGDGNVLILDEPTTGLHFSDVARLLGILRGMVDRGATVVTIEHNEDVIAAADWLVEVGPGAAAEGGRLVAQGPAAARPKRSGVTIH